MLQALNINIYDGMIQMLVHIYTNSHALYVNSLLPQHILNSGAPGNLNEILDM